MLPCSGAPIVLPCNGAAIVDPHNGAPIVDPIYMPVHEHIINTCIEMAYCAVVLKLIIPLRLLYNIGI